MAIQDQSTVIISIDLQADNAIEQADAIGKELAQIKQHQKELAAQNKQTSVSYQQNRQAIIDLQREQRAYINLANNQAGSNKQLRAQLSLLTNEYDSLGKEQRDATASGKALQVQIASINRELLKSEGATGRFQRNVGNYSGGVGQAIQTFAPAPIGGFLPQIGGAVTAFKQSIGFATQAVRDQQAATELMQISTVKATESLAAQAAASDALAASLQAQQVLEAKVAELEQARAAIGTELNAVYSERMAEEEAEIAILAQYAREQAILIAEEEVRIATEQQLLASQAELTASEEARTAAETELAAATAATAAASEASASTQTALASAVSIAGVAIIGVFVAIGVAIYSYLKQLDTFTDTTEQKLAYGGAVVKGWAKAFVDAFENVVDKGQGLSEGIGNAFDNIIAKTKAAGEAAAQFKEIFQNLGDLTDINELANQVTQNEVQQLRIQAKNRKLSNDEKQVLLDRADKIERDQLAKTTTLHEVILAENARFADRSLDGQRHLNDEQVKELQNGNLQLANNLLNAGTITKEAYDKLKEGYKLRNDDLQQANVQLEKIQNDADKFAERQRLADEKRAEEIRKINEDRAKSELETLKSILTDHEYELLQIDLDINKRKAMYQKYGQDTTQLEKERLARKDQLNQKWTTESLKKIEDYTNQAISLEIAGMEDSTARQVAQIEQDTKVKTDALDKQILALAARAGLGDNVNPEELRAAIDLRNGIVKAGEDKKNEILGTSSFDRQQAAIHENEEYERLAVQQQKFDEEGLERRLEINQALAQSYEDLFGVISSNAKKGSVLAKIAFDIEKAFAIQRIVIAANLARAKIAFNTAAAVSDLTAAAPLTFGASLLAIPGVIAAGAAETASVTVSEVASIAGIVASVIANNFGFAKGGRFESDGKGAVLPGYSQTDNTNARLRSGEAVIVSEAARDPQTRALLSDINVAYGGRAFAYGGMYGGSYLQNGNSSITNQVWQNNNLLRMITSQKIYTAITEVNDGQSRYAQITDVANH